MSALVGAGVGVALVPSLARTGHPQVADLQITPQPTRYIGAWLPRRHQPNAAAARLITALRTRARETADPGRARPGNPRH
jgi:DNA-binding transcriptional LysR family regulator